MSSEILKVFCPKCNAHWDDDPKCKKEICPECGAEGKPDMVKYCKDVYGTTVKPCTSKLAITPISTYSILEELKYPSTIDGVMELLNQIKDIEKTIELNNHLIKHFLNNSDAQQILWDDNEILFSIKKENIKALQHCTPELIKQAKGEI